MIKKLATLAIAGLLLTGCTQSMEQLHDQKYKECFKSAWDRWEKSNDSRMSDAEAEKWIVVACKELADRKVMEELKKESK